MWFLCLEKPQCVPCTVASQGALVKNRAKKGPSASPLWCGKLPSHSSHVRGGILQGDRTPSGDIHLHGWGLGQDLVLSFQRALPSLFQAGSSQKLCIQLLPLSPNMGACPCREGLQLDH